MPRRLKLSEREALFPPILVRLLVVRGRGMAATTPSDRELAEACGLSMAEFKFVSYSVSWADVTGRVRAAYLGGLGIDLENRRTMERLGWMRRRGTFAHLRRSPAWPQFEEMLEIWELSET